MFLHSICTNRGVGKYPGKKEICSVVQWTPSGNAISQHKVL